VTTNPIDFLKWRLVHIVRMWNKSHLYYYADSLIKYTPTVMPILNAIYLALSVIGILKFRRKLWQNHKFFCINIMIMLIGSTLFFALKPPEERLTVPLYPIIYLFAGIALNQIGRYLFSLVRTSRKVV
jgi:hypothetical protein